MKDEDEAEWASARQKSAAKGGRRSRGSVASSASSSSASSPSEKKKRRALGCANFYGAEEEATWRAVREARAARIAAAEGERRGGVWREFVRQNAAFAYVDAWGGGGASVVDEDDDDDEGVATARRWAADDVAKFQRDNEMIQYWAQDCGPLRLWAMEVGEAGQRQYVAAHWARFVEVYGGRAERHFYELIREGAPCRAYFDLEFAVECNGEIDGSALADRLCDVFAEAAEGAFYERTPLFAYHRAKALRESLYDACPDLDAQLRAVLWVAPDAATLDALDAAAVDEEAAAAAAAADADALKGRVLRHVAAVARRRALGEAFAVVDPRLHCAQLDATTATKFSRHAVWSLPDGACFADAGALGDFVKPLANDPAFRVRTPLKQGQQRQGASFVDTGVYTRNRLFRLAHSTKRHKKHAPLIPMWSSTDMGPRDRNALLPERALVIPLRPPPRLLGERRRCRRPATTAGPPQAPLPRPIMGPCSSSSSSSRDKDDDADDGKNSAVVVSWRAVLGSGRLPSPFPDLDAALVDAQRPGATVRKWERTAGPPGHEREGVLSYHLAGRNRFCERVGREHRSNNVILNIDLATSALYQTCYDPDCANWTSDRQTLPKAHQALVTDTLACELADDASRAAFP